MVSMAESGSRTEQQLNQLVAQAKQGDRDAFERIVDAYRRKIRDYAAKMLNDPSEAEDVAQQTFVRAYEAISDLRDNSRFQTWLYRIASNLAIDASRKRKRHRWYTVSLNENIYDDDATELKDNLANEDVRSPEEEMEATAEQGMIWEAVSQLTPKLRRTYILCDVQGLDYETAAAVMEIPLGTVKSRLFNARKQLKGKLGTKLNTPSH
ncbi:MAG: sigma-70 family RNA polymerase sigma factor [Armatimonadota bacterium]